ncbi:uncharacterized protein N0V89_008003 [Didymosphaeria variabile]|uniref:C3H1-type domain-containing protein n=1 Tax=Didymosphaeria variabile TaxID=1932322 RepID=A0A9W9C8G3_9PLEO|nr:uncharacterized protein N0V89_008003 [Didymosphaeria variabile]KAJ4349388.1 hypothetical protein N0V89_008003 [Didymosphaeria variabile]
MDSLHQQVWNVSKGEKRKRHDIDYDDDRTHIKVSRPTNTKLPGGHSTAKTTDRQLSSSVTEQALTPTPAAGKARKDATLRRDPHTPAPRPAASHQEYTAPTRNVFTEYHSMQAEFPPTPPETPPDSSSRAGSRLHPLLDLSVTSPWEFAEETRRLARLPKQRNESFAENQRIAGECERVKKELSEQEKRHQRELFEQEQRHQKELFEQEQRHQKELAEQQERLQKERDSEKAEYSIKLEAVEEALAVERQAKENLQKELTSKRIAIKNLEETLATVQQEKQSLNKAQTLKFQDLSSKHETAQKEKQDLSTKLATERKKKQDLSKKLASENKNSQYHDEQIKNEVQIQTFELAKRHVLVGLLRLYADDIGISAFTLENTAPSLHQKFFDLIDGCISYQELTFHIQNYFEEHPEEYAKIYGDGNGAVTVGNNSNPETQSNIVQSLGPVYGTGSWAQPAQGPMPGAQAPSGASSWTSGSNSQQPSQTFAPGSQAPGPFARQPFQIRDTADQPEDMDVDNNVVSQSGFSQPQSSQFPFSNPSGFPSSEAQAQDAQSNSMRVIETPGQPKICAYILHKGGCNKAHCKFSHPGEARFPIQVETINNLVEVVYTKHPSMDREISSYHNAIVWIFQNALQASLTRANRIIFLKMMEWHIETKLTHMIDDATPEEISRSSLPADELVAIASGLDAWFGKEFNMPEDLATIPPVLRILDGMISDKSKKFGKMPSSHTKASVSPTETLEQDLDDILHGTTGFRSSRPQPRNSQQSRSTNSNTQGFRQSSGFPAPPGRTTVADPGSKLLQDLNGILGAETETQSSNRRANRSQRSGNPTRGGSNSFPPRHPQSSLNRTSFGTRGGAHLSRPGNRFNQNDNSVLSRGNGSRIDTHAHRQPPRGPRGQSFPATPEGNFYAQSRQQNATRRMNGNPVRNSDLLRMSI